MKLRSDLYKRMLKSFPMQVTEEDKRNEGITQLRWMTLRDTSSTIRTLGFRIDGVVGYKNRDDEEEMDLHLARLKRRSETLYEFSKFAKIAATDDGQEPNGVSVLDVAKLVHKRLEEVRAALDASSFVAEHECIGSSLLLVADAYGEVG